MERNHSFGFLNNKYKKITSIIKWKRDIINCVSFIYQEEK